MVLATGSISVVVLVFACAWTAVAYDRVKLAQDPPRQPNFKIEKWMGRWYVQARLASCAWKGSNEFNDWDTQQTLEPDGSVLGIEVWRSQTGTCTTMSTHLYGRPGDNGAFDIRDPIGNVLTGEQYVVATDYKTITITSGCTKRSVDGTTCVDPWVTVMTRQRDPTPNTFHIVENLLRKLWSLSLIEMRRVEHTDECRPPPTREERVRIHPRREQPYMG